MSAVSRQSGPPIGTAIAAEAERWIDTPFHWQGRIRGAGCDCKGLIAGVAAACGRPEAASVEALAGDYGERIDGGRLRRGLARLFDRVGAPEAGDILLVRVSGKPQHLAIAAPDGGQTLRTIEALARGPMRVSAFRRRADEIDSVWRWKDLAGTDNG